MNKASLSKSLFVAAISATIVSAGCSVVARHGEFAVRADPFYVDVAPPPLQTDVIVPAPSPSHVWMPGEWSWHGRWMWEPGRWALPPHPHARWTPGHWDHRGNRWVHTAGRWS